MFSDNHSMTPYFYLRESLSDGRHESVKLVSFSHGFLKS